MGSVSFTVSFSGSLSPGLTCRVARSCATWAWAVLAASVARLAMVAIFGISGLARFGWYLSAVLMDVACDGEPKARGGEEWHTRLKAQRVHCSTIPHSTATAQRGRREQSQHFSFGRFRVRSKRFRIPTPTVMRHDLTLQPLIDLVVKIDTVVTIQYLIVIVLYQVRPPAYIQNKFHGSMNLPTLLFSFLKRPEDWPFFVRIRDQRALLVVTSPSSV